jgi:membrane protease YdiL (CAAX protease family)
MKKLMLKIRTLFIVLLIIAIAGIAIWLLEMFGNLVGNGNDDIGAVAFGLMSLGVVSMFVFFAIRRGKETFTDRKTKKQELLKEEIYAEIKRNH